MGRQPSCSRRVSRTSIRDLTHIQSIKQKYLHNVAAALESLEDLWQQLLDNLLHLFILVVTVLLLLATAVLWLMGLTLIATMLLAVMLLATSVIIASMRRDLVRRTASQVDVDAASVGFGVVLQAKFLTNLLDARFDLLDVVYGMVTLAHDPIGRALVFENIYSFLFPGNKAQFEAHFIEWC